MGKSQRDPYKDIQAMGNGFLIMIPKDAISGSDHVRLWDSINHNGDMTLEQLTRNVLYIEELTNKFLSIEQESKMQDIVQQTFNYGVSDFFVHIQVETEIEAVRMRMKRTAEDIVAIGQSLITIKAN